MGLFKSKAEKDMEKKQLVRKTMRNIEKYISGLQGQKAKAIESAKQAKLQGSKAQYSLALSALKTAMSQEKRAKEMLLNFELTLQMRDLSQMTAGFLDGMSIMSKEMKKITGDMDFGKVQKQFEEAMNGVEQTTDNLDAMLEDTDSAFTAISSANSNIDDKELEDLINTQILQSEQGMDKDIDSEIDYLKKSLSDLK